MHIGKSECDEAPARAASNNATGCTLTVDTGDNKLSPTDANITDKISPEASPESFRTSEFTGAQTHEFKYQARTECRKQYVAAGDNVSSVIYDIVYL